MYDKNNFEYLINMKTEVLRNVGKEKIRSAYILFTDENNDYLNREIFLFEEYSEQDYQEFLQKLDFNYPEYFMAIKIVGLILFENEYKWLEYEFDPITLKDSWKLHHKPSIGIFERCINYD